MQTCSTTNELVMLNPYTINTNTFVVSEGAVGDTTATVWTFVNGDATGPDATHLAPTLYPAAGRWVKNAGGSGGTNIFNTIIVTNLTVISNLTADTLWTNKASVLQPSNLTLPVMLTNQLSFSEAMTNVLYSTGSDLVYTNLNASGTFFKISSDGLNYGYYGVNGNVGKVIGPLALYLQGTYGVPNYALLNSTLLGANPDKSLDLGSAATHWKDLWLGGTEYIESYRSVGDFSRLAISQANTNSPVVFDIQTWGSGTNGANQGFSFRTNGVEVGWFGGSSNSFVKLAGDTMTGNLVIPNGTNTAPSLAFASSPTGGGFYSPGLGFMRYAFNNTNRLELGSDATGTYFWVMRDDGEIALGASADVRLFREAANTLALRNGVNAQAFNVYNTYTDGSNYKRLGISSSGTVFEIKSMGAGTGANCDPVSIGADGTAYLMFRSGGDTRWYVANTGHYLAWADNTYDIGANAANRPRNVYVGSSIIAGLAAAVGTVLYWPGSTEIRSAVNGVVVSVKSGTTADYATYVIGGLQGGQTKVLTSTTSADFLYVSVPNTNRIGGKVIYTIEATDGTDVQEISGDVKFAAVAKGTTVTATLADVQGPAALTGGSTLTATIASNVTTNNVWALGVTATTSLTTTNLLIKWRLETPSTFTVNPL